jgi:hypothetical protein
MDSSQMYHIQAMKTANQIRNRRPKVTDSHRDKMDRALSQKSESELMKVTNDIEMPHFQSMKGAHRRTLRLMTAAKNSPETRQCQSAKGENRIQI